MEPWYQQYRTLSEDKDWPDALHESAAEAGAEDLRAQLRQRQGLSWRLTLSLAGVMLAAVAIAMAGLYWAARKTDESAIRFERGLLRNLLDAEKERAAKEIENFAVSDTTYRNVHMTFDKDWAEGRIGERLATVTHDSIVAVVKANGTPRHITTTGSYTTETLNNQHVSASLDRMLSAVAETYWRTIKSTSDGTTYFVHDYGSHLQPTHATAFDSIGGKPVVVTVVAVLPGGEDTALIEGPPSMVVHVRSLEGPGIGRLGNVNRLQDLRFEASQRLERLPPNTLPLYNGASQLIGYLTWTPKRHGTSMLDEASPMMVLAMLVLTILAAGVLRHTHVTTVRLAYSEALARHRALHDDLSQLPNRVLFSRRLSEALESLGTPPAMVGVIYVDLDYFKEVNDTLGHHAGDALIKEVASRLLSSVAPGDVVSRISGDEFSLLICGRTDQSAIIDVCRHIEVAISEPFEIDDQQLHSSCSMGLVITCGEEISPAELLRRADIALYRAKEEGRGRYILYQESMSDEIRLSQKMERELRVALEEDQFELVYQPQVSADGRTTNGVEALIRWRHPEQGLLAPDTFMPIVERSDLIWQVGAWVIRTACRDGRQWPELSLAVNVSPNQIRHPDFAEVLQQILKEENFDPRRLEIEITESVVMDHLDSAVRIFDSLHGIGVSIALDDFGTGFSSLSYLRRFAFDKFKIDRAFITAVETEPESAAIVHTLIALADALGMKVTAEGIETKGQHRFLHDSGCDQLQGYLFSPPVPANEITVRLKAEEMARAAQGTGLENTPPHQPVKRLAVEGRQAT
ncbi:bifunctional diguanylate cyclase/phosphodiesterase [Breoghania sp.]|uniref:putative bifunctional diguanylate cyclase/phosphodiesterase n=1 Tax=Breoghania sp. TaxID=2065378 RepID=UPI0029CA8AE5|nr:bifunctional diguanylate cyclase/phosphodiesterase [Breoghania sp.]